MSRFFLDTHIVIWLLCDNSQLNNSLRDDILYPSGNQYVTSEFVIAELLHLKQLGKIDYAGDVTELQNNLDALDIGLELVQPKVFEVLDKIPILTIHNNPHTDMIDRIIIAQSIANKCMLVSHDKKFPYYREYGLKLLET